MSAQPTPRFTHDEFLDREVQSPFRHEFRQGRIEMMAGGTAWHSLITGNISAALRQALIGRRCFVFGPDLLVHIERAAVSTYPDVMVVCGALNYFDRKNNVIENPSVVIEVLSPSTENYDRGEKFAAYRQLPSLLEFVLVHQAEARAECFSRNPEGNWEQHEVSGIDGHLTLESLGCEVPLHAIYSLVEF